MKDDSEATAIRAASEVLSGSIIAGLNFILDSACGDNRKTLVEYKEVKKVRLTGRMRAALAYRTNSTAGENMLLNMKILHGIRNNITCRLVRHAVDGEPEAYYRDVEYK